MRNEENGNDGGYDEKIKISIVLFLQSKATQHRQQQEVAICGFFMFPRISLPSSTHREKERERCEDGEREREKFITTHDSIGRGR